MGADSILSPLPSEQLCLSPLSLKLSFSAWLHSWTHSLSSRPLLHRHSNKQKDAVVAVLGLQQWCSCHQESAHVTAAVACTAAAAAAVVVGSLPASSADVRICVVRVRRCEQVVFQTASTLAHSLHTPHSSTTRAVIPSNSPSANIHSRCIILMRTRGTTSTHTIHYQHPPQHHNTQPAT